MSGFEPGVLGTKRSATTTFLIHFFLSVHSPFQSEFHIFLTPWQQQQHHYYYCNSVAQFLYQVQPAETIPSAKDCHSACLRQLF